ncbi:hypothetical protein H257_13127 [Aphanomyces astaci]|uniref:Uncharacterized protein n=1 Tax=Aphanomyces astaci TaxID=112090 RepID=W4FY33_APHAT|nr:hypothetical protein H257_13127 [Aphanomyces astaci]ETV71694.1 hypothetical protein H257_13127 [Aphanomyces astaci]|eukprot:XP_009838882.1 hypothetical protein H257_13127 [Aphanomyces astaci]
MSVGGAIDTATMSSFGLLFRSLGLKQLLLFDSGNLFFLGGVNLGKQREGKDPSTDINPFSSSPSFSLGGLVLDPLDLDVSRRGTSVLKKLETARHLLQGQGENPRCTESTDNIRRQNVAGPCVGCDAQSGGF